MKNKLFVFFSFFIILSCSNDDGTELKIEPKNNKSEFTVSESDIHYLINEFEEDISNKGLLKNRISKITFYEDPKIVYKNSTDTSNSTKLYAVVINNEKTYFIAGDKRANGIYATLDIPVNLEKNKIPENLPDGFKAILENIIADIKIHQKINTQINPDWNSSNALMVRTDIKWSTYRPRCKVQWDQNYPFNNLCPIYKKDGREYRSAAGCVAIAAVQALTVVWDKNNNSFNGYTLKSSWDRLIQNPYGDDFKEGSPEKEDIENLVYNIGKSINMKYGETSGARTKDVVQLIVNQSKGRLKSEETKSAINIVSHMVRGGMTILSSRNKDNNGHAMLVDGYKFSTNLEKQKMYMHINYGWGKGYNGYFLADGGSMTNGNTQWVDNYYDYPYKSVYHIIKTF